MKYATVYIVIIIACLYSCRTNKRTDSSYKAESEITQETQTVARDSTAGKSQERDTSVRIAGEDKYIRVVDFDSLGRISSVREEWRNARSAELDVRDRRSSYVSVSTLQTDTFLHKLSKMENSLKTDFKSDSRPVQGLEWFWIIAVLVLAISGICICKFRSYGHKAD